VAKISSGSFTNTMSVTASSFAQAGGEMMLFSSYVINGGKTETIANGFDGRFYYLEVYEPDGQSGETLVHRYVPCKNANGDVVLYDAVTHQ